MKFNYEIKDKSLVTPEEYKQLDYLRFEDGCIWPAFNNRAGYVIIAKENDKIIAWAFIFKRVENKFKTFYVYVKKGFRRNGIGSKIYKMAKVIDNDVYFNVSRWSNVAEKFYDRLEE